MKFSSPAPYPRREGLEDKKTRIITKEEDQEIEEIFRIMEPDNCWNSSNSDTPDEKIEKTG